jgi:hypothetical protein
MQLRKIIIVLFLVATSAVSGADRARAGVVWFMMTYEPSLAVGKTADFIDSPGYIGFGVESRSFETGSLAWSFSAAWHNMYQTSDDLIHVDNVTISGTQVRYLDFVPILLGTEYHFFSRGARVRPFAGFSAGAYWVTQKMDIGTVEVIFNKKWHIGVVPEVGITFLTPDLEFYGFVSSDFNYIFSRGDSIDYTYVTVKLGFVYLL